jgi:NADH:ubiquinone oxidoreductase subunit 6 (subunit J)
MVVYILVAVGIIVAALLAILSKRLLVSALWLALTSALVSVMAYLLGAAQIAVIELSVGAGLVTVLFVFAINMAGEERALITSLIPKPLAWILVLVAIGLLGYMIVPKLMTGYPIVQQADLANILWTERYLDILLQIALIFCGVLGMIGLFADDAVKKEVEKLP